MWPTLDGVRRLVGDEADLIRKVSNVIINRIKTEQTQQDNIDPFAYGIDWFDQWEPDQRIWLIEQVVTALLSDQPPPEPAAMWEATIDVLYLETLHQIEQEMESGSSHWRDHVTQLLPNEDTSANPANIATWRSRVTHLADRILANPSYQKAEAYRDDDPKKLRKFLQQRCLPEDYLDQIPPARP